MAKEKNEWDKRIGIPDDINLDKDRLGTIEKYLKHLPTCNIMQDWSEAEIAMADTPEKYRDHEWEIAREELNVKKGTCTCGLIAIKEALNL